VQLSLFHDGLRLSGNRHALALRFSFLVPRWESRYDELVEIAAVGTIEGITSGVLFRTAERSTWAVFWTVNRREVLGALENLGVSVVSTPRRFRYFHPYR
jgi:hypothetical protein